MTRLTIHQRIKIKSEIYVSIRVPICYAEMSEILH